MSQRSAIKTLPQRWRYALKPASWPKLLAPMLLGQALGVHAALRAERFDAALCTWVLVGGTALTLCNLAYIVLINDWADRQVDAIKRRMFPDAGSPKTIYDGILPAAHVLLGGCVAGAASLLVALGLALRLSNPWLPLGVALGLAVFWSYSLPPLRLNYRGGGEVMEMLGVGLVFPWIFYCGQSGQVLGGELWLVLGTIPMALSSAVASGLSDEESDRRGGKRTFVTLLGNPLARRLIRIALLAAIFGWGISAVLAPLSLWVPLGAALAVQVGYLYVARADQGAERRAFVQLSKLKQMLHLTIWGGQGILAVLVILHALFM